MLFNKDDLLLLGSYNSVTIFVFFWIEPETWNDPLLLAFFGFNYYSFESSVKDSEWNATSMIYIVIEADKDEKLKKKKDY